MRKFLFLLFPLLLQAAPATYEIVTDKNPLQIKTPALAERKTLKIRLKNGLEAYLISDPGANQSAAAVAVNAGSWDDPSEYPGMAHFCEHMLFMGSATYPDENGFFQSVIDAGGLSNAYTASDRTVYMFSSSHAAFSEILDYFAHFFIDPLFKQDAVARELLAVNQEFQKNIEHDGWRAQMIFKETGNPNHPNAKFSTGTADTLKVIPLETLRSWYKQHYGANRMHLVIYSNQSLERLVEFTVASFSDVTPSYLPTSSYEPLTSPRQKGHILYISPVRDLRQFSLCWEMPPEIALDIDAAAPGLVGFALSNKGENSLFTTLKSEGLIEDISFDIDKYDARSSLLNLNFSLTKQGVEELDQVILRTFQTIYLYKEKGIPFHLFQEAQTIATLQYEWQSRTNPFQLTSSTVEQMPYEPFETFPYRTNIPQTFKAKAVNDTLALMSPKNTLYLLLASPELAKYTPDTKEKWNGGLYTLSKIEEQKLTLWENPPATKNIALPKANPFLPNDLSILEQTTDNEFITPHLLVNEPIGKCFVLQDHHYLVPEASIRIGIKSPEINSNIKNIALTDLYILTLENLVSGELSNASRAGIHATLSQQDLKLLITIDGYSDKSSLLLTTLLKGMKKNIPSMEVFELYKDDLLSSYENKKRSLPFYQSQETLRSILLNYAPTSTDLYNALQSITYREYVTFADALTKRLYFEALISGNKTPLDAKKVWNEIKLTLPCDPYPVQEQEKCAIRTLSQQAGPFMIENKSELQGNATLLMLQLGESTNDKFASLQVLDKALSEAFFSTLRSKQQTGYMTKNWSKEEWNELMIFFIVHSTTHCNQELLARFELFIEDFSRNLETTVPIERFNQLKFATIDKLSRPPENLPSKANELYTFAYKYNEQFHRRQNLIDALNALTYADFLSDSKNFLSRQNTRRLAVLFAGPPSDPRPLSYILTTEDALKRQ